ncbi:MAG: mechanosensitive ion channel family protein [Mycobacterium sp.]
MVTAAHNPMASDNAWNDFWHGDLGGWLLTRGLHTVLVVIFAVLATRFIRWGAAYISRQLAETDKRDAVLHSEAVKHRQALASIIASVGITVLYASVAIDIARQLGLPLASLVAPASVLGAAFGFGAQRIVQDLLAGFFLITEKQYGFGDLVELTVSGGGTARGTVEDATLRVTQLRNSDGEVYSIPNGQIVKVLNLSKDWARAVVDVPVPASADINEVGDVLRSVASAAMDDDDMRPLLLDQPQVMGVESIEVDTVNVRIVARTLPGKQFDVGRQLRAHIVAGLAHAGVATKNDQAAAVVGAASNAESGAS